MQTKVCEERKPSGDETRQRRTPLTGAERQRRYEERRNWRELAEAVAEFTDALATAAELGRSAKLTNHLPEEPVERMRELTRRLTGQRVVMTKPEAAGRSHKRRKARRWSRMFPAETKVAVFEMGDARRAIRAALLLGESETRLEAQHVLRQLVQRQSERYQRELRRALEAVGLYDRREEDEGEG